MKLLKIAAGSLGLLALLENFRELHDFRVTEYEITSEKLAGLEGEASVLFLSDLHNHRYGRGNRRLLEAVRRMRPDLILIGGDMVVAKDGHTDQTALEFVQALPDIAPVYYANGNHEQRLKEHPERYQGSYLKYREKLEAKGVSFLENRTEEYVLNGVRLFLTGLEIPLEDYTRFYQRKLEMREIEERIGHRRREGFSVLLAHNPSYMKQYLDWGADLILSGHYHGGLVRLPGVGAVMSPGFQLFPPYSGGRYRENGQDIVVSKGLGTHTFHIRLGNPAEAILLRLSGAPPQA